MNKATKFCYNSAEECAGLFISDANECLTVCPSENYQWPAETTTYKRCTASCGKVNEFIVTEKDGTKLKYCG